jgi:uncharacterized protein
MEIHLVPFFHAVKQGDRPTVEAMLAENPQLAGMRDQSGLSAVLAALYYQQPEIADLLIDRGAPLNLFEAAAAGRIAVVREILDQAPDRVNARAADGFQPLGLACFFGHTALAEFLLERGAEVSAPSSNLLNVQPIHSAAAGQHLEIVRLLLDHGADPNARQADGYTPLHSAAQNGQAAMVRLLLEHKADRYAENSEGITPVDLARQAGHEEAVALLTP